MENLTSAPVLSTPDDRILSETNLGNVPVSEARLSDAQLYFRYEIGRTIDEIRNHSWKRVALQFPDEMLVDSARVYQRLARGLSSSQDATQYSQSGGVESAVEGLRNLSVSKTPLAVKLLVLGDTSYGSCCVDEVAAEHVEADAIVHYGRACLSPTSRIPALHIFTTADLDHDRVVEAFMNSFVDLSAQVVLTAEAPFSWHVASIAQKLGEQGYTSIFASEIVHDPSSVIPNRTVPDDVKSDHRELQHWHVFHISKPPTALLLTLSSRVKNVLIYPVPGQEETTTAGDTSETNTAMLLRRRYALVTSMAAVSTWGILINTLSVKNYLHVVEHVKRVIAASGKRCYLFVVGKVNPAKIANFSEIGGWVVIGCWESSLIDSKDFYKPIITPFELELALAGDGNRVWTGQWTSDFQNVLDHAGREEVDSHSSATRSDADEQNGRGNDFDSEEESEPPEFDLRTGRYVSRSRPTNSHGATAAHQAGLNGNDSSQALTKRANRDVVSVNGVASPAAQFLAENRTWKGLGSDFEIKYEDDEEVGALLQEGRSGIARGYHEGDSNTVR